MDRTISPIYITNDENKFNNTLNSMMDHVWDGFYTGQKRFSRFSSIIRTDWDYTVTTTGTQPGNMRYRLQADKGGVMLSIPYFNAGSYAIEVDGTVIEPTSWDEAQGSQANLTKTKGCGENRYIAVVNILEFYLTAGCEVKVKPQNSIKAAVRMDWTMDEFYGKGGVTKFSDNVAAALGIHASQIKVVAVYEGSVIVEYNVIADENDPDPEKTLNKVKENISILVEEKSDAFGAPILSAVTEGEGTSFAIKAANGGSRYESVTHKGKDLDDVFAGSTPSYEADPYANVPARKRPTYSSPTNVKESENSQEDPLIITERVVVTETRIIRKEARAEGGSFKFIVVGLIVFMVATVGVVALVVTTCNRDTVRMAVNTTNAG